MIVKDHHLISRKSSPILELEDGSIVRSLIRNAGSLIPEILATTISTTGGGGGATTPAINTIGASILIVSLMGGTAFAAPTDSAGNTWVALTGYQFGGSARIFYCLNPTTSAAHTFTSTAAFPVIGAIAAKNVTAFNEESGLVAGSTNSVSVSLALVKPKCLVVTAIGGNIPGTFDGIDNDFIILKNDYEGGVNYGGAMAYNIVDTPVSLLWNFTILDVGCVIASFY